jgi:hypothetical protein
MLVMREQSFTASRHQSDRSNLPDVQACFDATGGGQFNNACQQPDGRSMGISVSSFISFLENGYHSNYNRDHRNTKGLARQISGWVPGHSIDDGEQPCVLTCEQPAQP